MPGVAEDGSEGRVAHHTDVGTERSGPLRSTGISIEPVEGEYIFGH